MADTISNIKTISRTNSGFPAYLDFSKLREDALDYLGQLTGKIWTDYNLHDPGITTIEMLCYALLDLGYRTNFSSVDIFSRDPNDTGADNNFLTPSQLLTCNPITIIDYRKLLIDIDGVRNAWLEIATDVKDICKQPSDRESATNVAGAVNNQMQDTCLTYLNGLYHVYIELEDEKTDPAEEKLYEERVLKEVRDALMQHRNLCEDFADIYILCKLNVGICADIELETDADAETVYKTLISSLQDFMDPSPRFYTLQELLDKGKSIDDIFSGRPYNLSTSHGFTDTDELEEITLKKEIHLSDIYNLLTNIPGIRTVRRLQLQVCRNNTRTPLSGWKFSLPRNNIPVFSTNCSGIQFSQNGKVITPDFNKLNQYLDLRFSGVAKILFTETYPYLDAAIPKGLYRKNIDEYYSIQNEYPRVYGIGEGGLPDDAPVKRQAQALQFKGYLLFFDQLLANYLMQLKNIRSLFSFTSSPSNASGQTYFWQEPGSIPGLQKLLRFDTAGIGTDNSACKPGILATPVNKTVLLNALNKSPFNSADIDALSLPYYFSSETERDFAIDQLIEDFQSNNGESIVITSAESDSWFYFGNSSDDWAIISKKYGNAQSLSNDLVSIQYLGASSANYRKDLSPDGNSYSFVIDSTASGYINFLQQIAEDKELYRERRNGFLDHLLARFAEQFTDYALLLLNTGKEKKAEDKVIKAKENFLTNYGELSSNRGKAFDYLGRPFSLDNVSGFEDRVTALAGWNNCGSVNLCNFVVETFEEQFIIFAKFDEGIYFTSEDKFYSKEQGEVAVRSLFNALQSASSYDTFYDKNEDAHKIRVNFGENKSALLSGVTSPIRYELERIKDGLYRMFSRKPVSDKVYTSKTVFRIVIKNSGEEFFCSKEHFDSESLAREQYKRIGDALTDSHYWDVIAKEKTLPGKIYIDQREPDVIRFIDLKAFKIDINNGILGKPDKFNFEILDLKNRFRIESKEEFDSSGLAETAAGQLLIDISDRGQFEISETREENEFHIGISSGGKAIAQHASVFILAGNDEEAANAVSEYARKNLYIASIEEKAFRYRFEFFLDSIKGDEYLFRSIEEYDEPVKAAHGGSELYKDLPNVVTNIEGNQLQLVKKSENGIAALCQFVNASTEPTAVKDAIDQLLELKKKMIAIPLDADPSTYEEFVNNDIQNKDQKYVYRLVDKDHLHAFYIGWDQGAETLAVATAKRTELFQDCHGYEYIEICLGGDIFCVRVDEKTGQLWYHYQLKANHPLFPNGESVLFESVQGYASEDEAQTAFDAIFAEVMNRAMMPGNYGTGQYISIDEILVEGSQTDPSNKAAVFVPNETKRLINAYNDAQLVNALVSIAKKYPVRRITNDCRDRKEWEKRFPCFPVPGADNINCDDCSRCNEVQAIATFYYYVLTDKQGNEAWQSVSYFTTIAEARVRFHFFLPLLCYPGNYFVDSDPCRCVPDDKQSCKCRWEIYIREVLLESKNRFVSEELAWSAVEECICVTQSPGAFHRYFNKKNCGNSFFVACARGGLIHPCWYSSERKRNHALDRLFKTAKEYFDGNHISFFSVNTPYTIYDIDGNELAQFPVPANPQNDLPAFCSRFLKFVESIGKGNEFKEKDEGFYLLGASGETIVSTANKNIGFEKWQQQLKEVAYFFPVITSADENGKVKYCVEIRLPHFNHAKSDDADEQECGCGHKPVQTYTECWVAWRSDCCFSTCVEALNFYFKEITLLTNYNNYRAVFECDCGGFGIELVTADEIIAINPLRYATVKGVCEAIDRAKCLINCNGLHLVEHILLRPRCEEDCRCDYLQKDCGNKSGCKFEWSNGDQEDPCNEEKKICFVPGADPYSFIATIALPAWTRQMRNQENRRVIENLLYREAPAHVLLRILWLTPKDLFLFEQHFRKWEYWLGWNKECNPNYSECDFLKFLFDTEFECLNECNICLPCETDTTAPLSCFTDDPCQVLSDPAPNAFLNQVNEMFCWTQLVCEEVKAKDTKDVPSVIAMKRASIAAAPVPESRTTTRKPKPAVEKKEKVKKEKIEISEEDVERKIDERFTRYRGDVQQMIDSGAKNTSAAEVLLFLQLYQPGEDRFRDMIGSILENEKPKGRSKKKFTKSQQRLLINNATYYFCDNCVFYDLKVKNAKELATLFGRLKQHKLLPDKKGWNEKDVKLIKPKAALKEIHKLLK